MRKKTKLLLGALVGAIFASAGAPAAWAQSRDELVCVDLSTTKVGCCLVGSDGAVKKCFEVNVT